MSPSQSEIEATFRSFLTRAKKPVEALELEQDLYADGIGLDSLETAELSAVLEDAFGTDPFSEGEMPQTYGDIVAFYGAITAEA